MTSDATDYHVSTVCDAFEGDELGPHPHRNRIDPEGPHMTAASSASTTSTSSAATSSAMVAFYRELLGLELRLPYERGQGWAGFRAGDVVIYLIEDEGASAPHPPPRFRTGADNPPGIDSFAFEVDVARRGDRRARRAGCRGRARSSTSDWYRYRGIHDPEGNLVYLHRAAPRTA